ncbi:MAG: enoyl-CoA hydratase/isomerase family protein [Deltaproteobacteria bacterium]|nr:enoyl-CoA hydratase/isomerase family protein [Deltaproteobacteria bacterium]
MSQELIQVRINEKVAVATMNNPPANALSPTLRDEFMDKLKMLAENDDVWVVIITAAGEKFFAAGADIPTLLDLDEESGLARVRTSRAFYSGIAAMEKPVIAAINGMCFGGGCEMALACDIRVAADHAKLGLPEVNLGLIPGAGGTQRLPRAVGPGWGNYLLFTGDAISAAKAYEIGLVQEVVPAAELLDTALAIAGRINKKGPLAVRAAKRAASRGMQETLEKGLDIENQAFGFVCGTQDKNEGVTAFLEKRKPNFQCK